MKAGCGKPLQVPVPAASVGNVPREGKCVTESKSGEHTGVFSWVVSLKPICLLPLAPITIMLAQHEVSFSE